jgi:hypothetical protein
MKFMLFVLLSWFALGCSGSLHTYHVIPIKKPDGCAYVVQKDLLINVKKQGSHSKDALLWCCKDVCRYVTKEAAGKYKANGVKEIKVRKSTYKGDPKATEHW